MYLAQASTPTNFTELIIYAVVFILGGGALTAIKQGVGAVKELRASKSGQGKIKAESDDAVANVTSKLVTMLEEQLERQATRFQETIDGLRVDLEQIDSDYDALRDWADEARGAVIALGGQISAPPRPATRVRSRTREITS
jgi:hypothetical protein